MDSQSPAGADKPQEVGAGPDGAARHTDTIRRAGGSGFGRRSELGRAAIVTQSGRGSGAGRPVPGSYELGARQLWQGLGEAWTALTTLVCGIAVWGGIGYGIDRLAGTWPVLFVIGVLVGNFAGIYLVYFKYFREGPSRAS